MFETVKHALQLWLLEALLCSGRSLLYITEAVGVAGLPQRSLSQVHTKAETAGVLLTQRARHAYAMEGWRHKGYINLFGFNTRGVHGRGLCYPTTTAHYCTRLYCAHPGTTCNRAYNLLLNPCPSWATACLITVECMLANAFDMNHALHQCAWAAQSVHARYWLVCWRHHTTQEGTS